MSYRVYSAGMGHRRQWGSNALDYTDHYGVRSMRQHYYFLRRRGVDAGTARSALWQSAWMGVMYQAEFVGKSDAFPALAEVAEVAS